MPLSSKKLPAVHRIGAVSSLSGVPVPTLRVWEVRYTAFAPAKTEGHHRLYHDEDVLRATLLRQLTEHGHAISSIANLDSSALNNLLQQQRSANLVKSRQGLEANTVSMAIVGLPLAGRIESSKFTLSFVNGAIRVTDIFMDLETAMAAPFQQRPQLLMVKVNSLHAPVQVDLHRLIEKNGIQQVIVIYRYGQENIVESMKRSGMIVRREPIPDAELADLISAVMLMDTAGTAGGAMIPPRRYNDQTLARVAGMSTSVLCECPRHVAEIIAQLASFEQYSQECLNKSSEDAHLHAYLTSVSGSARVLFENALALVAKQDGIDLDAADPATTKSQGKP